MDCVMAFPGCPVNGAIDTGPAQKRAIGGVNDGVDRLLRYVALYYSYSFQHSRLRPPASVQSKAITLRAFTM